MVRKRHFQIWSTYICITNKEKKETKKEKDKKEGRQAGKQASRQIWALHVRNFKRCQNLINFSVNIILLALICR